MPYIAKGKTVYKKEGGHLKKVGTTKGSVREYLAALYMHADKGFYAHRNTSKSVMSTGGMPKVKGC